MNRIALFNPEHDMALANGDRHFIAPRNIREMGRDLAPLLELIEGDNLLVWGWDYAVKNYLLRMGVAANLLPSEKALTALRQRSGRASAHHLLTAFHAAHPTGPYVGESILVHDIDEILPYAAKHKHIILKDPFSSSGKGLRHIKGGLPLPCPQAELLWEDKSSVVATDAHLASARRGETSDSSEQNEGSISSLSFSLKKVENWAEALLRRHGYLTAEPYYNKMQDFAMEFRADSDGCHFIGYSYFNTNAHGRYESNLLAPDEKIENLLARHIPHSALHELRDWIVSHSHLIIPTEWDTTKHPLHFGIDMMLVETTDNGQQATDKVNFQFSIFNSQFKIHPCVEINLRLNMGIIAHEVHRKLLANGAEGTFHVTAFPTKEALQAFQAEQIRRHPATYREGLLIEGYHPLTSIQQDTRHHAYILL